MVMIVAAQGMYRRAEYHQADGVKPCKPDAFKPLMKHLHAGGELIFWIPKSTDRRRTPTTSLAEMPAISATTICQKPRPAGANTGTI